MVFSSLLDSFLIESVFNKIIFFKNILKRINYN